MADGVYVEWKSRQGRYVLVATIMASGVAFLDSSVVTVALPHIESDLGGGLPTLQWVLDGYLLTLGALLLVGGSIGDLIGKRRVFIWGTVAFGIASVLCGLSPTAHVLIGARMLQGAAAAAMVPTSLAILNSIFKGSERARAIGAWSGLAGLFTMFGPFVGGLFVDMTPWGWRLIFLLNIPLVIGAVIYAKRGIPDLPGTRTSATLFSQVDVLGGILTVIGLGLIVGPLIEFERLGSLVTGVLVAVGVGVLVVFFLVENHRGKTHKPPPMVRLKLFRLRTFSVANVVTFVIYGAMGGAFFLITVALQQGLGYSALAAGAAGVPVTLVLAGLSSKMGAVMAKIGARPMLTAGPLLMAAGFFWFSLMEPGDSYWAHILPPYLVFSAGLVLVVTPVTATALSEIPDRESGAGSGVNNAVARIASLVVITLLPIVSGMSAGQSENLATGDAFLSDFGVAMYISAGLCVVGGLVSLFGFRRQDGMAPDPDLQKPKTA